MLQLVTETSYAKRRQDINLHNRGHPPQLLLYYIRMPADCAALVAECKRVSSNITGYAQRMRHAYLMAAIYGVVVYLAVLRRADILHIVCAWGVLI